MPFLEEIQGCSASIIERRTSFCCRKIFRKKEVHRSSSSQRFNHAPSSKKTIQQNVKKYRSHGTSLNRNKENSGRRRTALSEENIERVRNMLENNLRNISARRNGMGLSAATFNRITRGELCWYPYRVKVRQQSKENDFQRSSDFSYWFLQQCNNPSFLCNIVIGDEALFAKSGTVNTWNEGEYPPTEQVPEFIYEGNDLQEKIAVWAGLCGNGTLWDRTFSTEMLMATIIYK